MKYVLILALSITINIFASEKGTDTSEVSSVDTDQLYKSIESFKINKDEIRKSLENLKASGKITNADYLKSLEELNKMDDKKIEDLSKKAVDMIKNQGAKAGELPKSEPKK